MEKLNRETQEDTTKGGAGLSVPHRSFLGALPTLPTPPGRLPVLERPLTAVGS